MRHVIVGVTLLSCIGVVRADDSATRSVHHEISIPAGTAVALGLAVGELTVESAAVDAVSVDIEARCREGAARKCRRRLEDIRTETSSNDAGTSIRIVGVRKRAHHMEVEARIVVPESSPLAVKMYAGEMQVAGGGQSLDIRLKFGDVTVHQPLAATRSVFADANIGDAEIYSAVGEPDPHRPFLVGSEVTWDEGEGEADVAVNLGVGSATVYLE
jgi:hypothetical protein